MSHLVKRTAVALVAGAVMTLGMGTQVSAGTNDGASGFVNLSTQQETCLASARSAAKGSTKEVRRATIKSAAQACGIWKRFSKLSADQQACLAANGLTKPKGLPTKAQRKQLRSLASSCGVTLRIKG